MSNRRNLTDRIPPNEAQYNMTDEDFREVVDYSPVPVLQNPQFQVRPGTRPTDLFAVKPNRCTISNYRFIRKNNKRQMLMFVDGACINNGSPNARAGWAVCVGPEIVIKGRLEPPEDSSNDVQTSNRAELRSAIVALGLRIWKGEGFSSVVIASDSEYVVRGYCERLPKWKQRNWTTARGTPVLNKDLWEVLDNMVQTVASRGAQVLFWRIPREWNEADKYAKQAAAQDRDGATTSSSPLMLVPQIPSN